MKRIKEKTLTNMIKSLTGTKKYGGLIAFTCGLIVGIIRYFVCKNFQCAFGYFAYTAMIIGLISMFMQMTLKVVIKKQLEYYKESIANELDSGVKKLLGINDSESAEDKTNKEV